jgi:hypothetical protein
VVALVDASAVLTRFWVRRQPYGATIIDTTLTNCLKVSGAWMTDGGASSESALRTVVLSLWVWGCRTLDRQCASR